MLKSQEIEIDGQKFSLREPRIRDHIEASKSLDNGPDAYALAMLSRMLVREDGTPVGLEFISDLPMRVFNTLARAMEDFKEGPLGVVVAPSSD